MEVAQNLWQLLDEWWIYLEELSEYNIRCWKHASLLPGLFGFLLRPSTVYVSPVSVRQSQILPIAVVILLLPCHLPFPFARRRSGVEYVSTWVVAVARFCGDFVLLTVCFVPCDLPFYRTEVCWGTFPSWCRICFNVSADFVLLLPCYLPFPFVRRWSVGPSWCRIRN